MTATATEAPTRRPSRREPDVSVILEVRDARKTYGSRTALDGVSLSLRQGEIYALLGPNGAGKTTLIRAICGRLALDSGTARIAGRDPRGERSARCLLGLVPQEIALYPDLTSRENLEILGRLAGVAGSRLAAAVDEALEWTRLAGRARDLVGSLSGGMKRRLNIAAGTLHRPKVLLLDEPTVGIDPSARESIHEMLLSLRDAGMTVLLTTHDMDQAEALADRIGILLDGLLRAEGDLDCLVRGAFGDAKELAITLSRRPDPAGRALLQEVGLEPDADEQRWDGRLGGGLGDLSALGERMLDAGLAVAEVRVREPGLRGVFFHVTGREFDA